MDQNSMTQEEIALCEKEALLCFWSLRFYDFFEALKGCIKQGTLQKNDILRSFEQNFKFQITEEHEKFVASFEKKTSSSQTLDSNHFLNINKPQYIPARKFFTSLILLGKDFPCDKADQIFQLYDTQLEGYLTIHQFKELVDHLYYLNLYALPAMIDKSHDHHYQIQYLKQEMLKNAQADKQNLVRKFTGINHKLIMKEDFKYIFSQQTTLQNALGLRQRIMPVVGCSTSEIYTKIEMLKRCYAQKAAEKNPKRVRFYIQQGFDDYLTVKSSRSVRSEKKLKTYFSNEALLISPNQSETLKSPSKHEITADEDISGTREDSTQSEDKQHKRKQRQKEHEDKVLFDKLKSSSSRQKPSQFSAQKSSTKGQSQFMLRNDVIRRRSNTQQPPKRQQIEQPQEQVSQNISNKRLFIAKEIYKIEDGDIQIRVDIKDQVALQ